MDLINWWFFDMFGNHTCLSEIFSRPCTIRSLIPLKVLPLVLIVPIHLVSVFIVLPGKKQTEKIKCSTLTWVDRTDINDNIQWSCENRTSHFCQLVVMLFLFSYFTQCIFYLTSLYSISFLKIHLLQPTNIN